MLATGLEDKPTIKKGSIVAKLQISDLAADIKGCLKECNEAIQKVMETYRETKDDVKSMSSEEEKQFIVEAFRYVYDEADTKWEFNDFMDAAVKSIAIPEIVKYVYK